MDVFFVRHGETLHNRKHLHQPDDAVLTELGRKQAQATEPLIVRCDPTHLISSTFTRAAETAEILNKDLLLAVERNELFVELRRPTYLTGCHHFGLRSIWYILRWFFSKNDAYWESIGGESRPMFYRRLREARRYIEAFPGDARIVIVSHSIFINYFVQHICSERPINVFQAVLLLLKIRSLDNSSITHIVYDSSQNDGTCKWRLVRVGEDAHVVT